MIRKCGRHSISFTCLPLNFSNIIKPLDLAYCRPLKVPWCKTSMNLEKKCLIIENNASKTIFLFPEYTEKVVFPKKLHWNLIFVELSRNTELFPEIKGFFLTEMKDHFPERVHWLYDIFNMIDKLDISFSCQYNIPFWSKNKIWASPKKI